MGGIYTPERSLPLPFDRGESGSRCLYSETTSLTDETGKFEGGSLYFSSLRNYFRSQGIRIDAPPFQVCQQHKVVLWVHMMTDGGKDSAEAMKDRYRGPFLKLKRC